MYDSFSLCVFCFFSDSTDFVCFYGLVFRAFWMIIHTCHHQAHSSIGAAVAQ